MTDGFGATNVFEMISTLHSSDSDIEVGHMSATPAGLEAAVRLGEEKGNEFLGWFMARDQGS
jgi:hypothetical protein